MTIHLNSVRKTFGSHAALDDVSLDIETGEFFVVLGPSGCGKSTLLRAIAGLEPVDSGTIALGEKIVAGSALHLAPESRNVGVVFQSYALWPHMSVAGNVAFPLETAKLSKPEVQSRTRHCLETVELTSFANRKPADLSGGQRQRVALARCLAQSAETILMDEPLANLDPHLRSAMEEELADFHKQCGSTTLFITHDQREAMALADRVALMWDGKILQADAPDVLYNRPGNERAAGFIGRSTVVMLEISAVRHGLAEVAFAGRTSIVACAPGTGLGSGKLMIRPEHVVPCSAETGFPARVQRVTYRGGYWEAHVSVNGTDTPLLINLTDKVTIGDRMHLQLENAWLLPGS